MIEHVKRVLAGQFEASHCMLGECIEKCPGEHWDSPIAKYPFWQVAYHTLCFVDFYLSPGDAAWRPRLGDRGLHPRARAELDDEYPSRRFEKPELLEYLAICRAKLSGAIAAETSRSLEGPTGFPRLPFSRGELYIYSIRHIQHHAGQLGALLRRVGAMGEMELRWVGTGWRN